MYFHDAINKSKNIAHFYIKKAYNILNKLEFSHELKRVFSIILDSQVNRIS